MSQNRAETVPCRKLVSGKGLVSVWSPGESGRFAMSERGEMRCYPAVVLNKPAVKVSEAKKTLQVLEGSRLRPSLYSRDLLIIHG